MKKIIFASFILATSQVALADNVIVDDLIVNGSACIGVDCANGYNFGFDTFVLKENNLRMYFDDSSSSGSFPSNDWRFTFNDSGNGGSSFFSVDDASAGKSIFKVEAGAPANALYVDSQGDVGVGTSTPVLELQVTDGDSPGLRLEQNSSSGWTAQTWDISGNETNFFVRDVTNGSKLPFKIRPNSPDSSIDITANGVKIPKVSGGIEMASSSNIELTMSGGITTWTLKNNANTGRLALQDATNGTSPLKFFPAAAENLVKVGEASASIVTINGDIYIKAKDGNLISLQDLIDVVEALNGSALPHK